MSGVEEEEEEEEEEEGEENYNSEGLKMARKRGREGIYWREKRNKYIHSFTTYSHSVSWLSALSILAMGGSWQSSFTFLASASFSSGLAACCVSV